MVGNISRKIIVTSEFRANVVGAANVNKLSQSAEKLNRAQRNI